MIKANELRIGNWVSMSDFEFKNRGAGSLNTRYFSIKGFGDGTGREGCKQILFWEIPVSDELGGKCCSGSYDADVLPIPITPEWLERLGALNASEYKGTIYDPGIVCDKDWIRYIFDHSLNEDLSYNSTLELELEEDGFWSIEYYGTKIQYVHQLQNLYFALTGEELTLTTPENKDV